MIEGVLALSNLLLVISVLVYFTLKEDRDRRERETNSDTAIINAGILLDKLKDISQSKDMLTQKILVEYLKHNERLEKMVLPQPVTRKAVQEVLDHMPPTVPNDIEKDDTELEKEQMDELLNRMSITRDTKVAIEGDNGFDADPGVLDEEIISGQF